MLISNPRFEPRRNPPSLPAHIEGAGPLPYARSAAGISLDMLISALRERLWLILAVVLLMAGIGFAAGKMLPNSYTADGLMVIETQRVDIPGFQTVRSERTVEPWGGRSEAQVITSRAMVARTVDALGLYRHPDFNPPPQPPLLERLGSVPWLPESLRELLDSLVSDDLIALDASAVGENAATAGDVVEWAQRRLRADSEAQSYAIRLSFTASDPTFAADFINMLMQVHVDAQIQAKREFTLRANQDLRSKADELLAELQATRQRIRDLEADTAVVQSGGTGTVTSQALLALHQERRSLDAEMAILRSDRDQINDAIASGRSSVLNEKLVPPRLLAIWDSQAEIQRMMADSMAQFGPRHPRMIALQSELDGLRREAAAELEGLLRDLGRRLVSLDARAENLDQQIAEAQGQAALSAQGRATLNQLQSEADSQEALYNIYRERSEQSIASVESAQADVRIVSPAAPPSRPSSPGASMLAAVGALLGFAISSGLVIARRFLGDSIDNLEEAVAVSGRPALGSVPTVHRGFWRKGNLPASVQEHSGNAAAETLRGIILRLQQPGEHGTAPRVVMFTSAVPGDGKSSTVAAAARIAADEGLRCLVIDADFRKSGIAELLGIKQPAATLEDYFAGRLQLADAVVADSRSDAHFLLSRSRKSVNRRFLEDPRMEAIFSWARSRYDLILIDTPPVMRVVDALVLSQYADATVMVIAWRSAKRETVRAAIQRLEQVNAPILGVVLSRLGGGASKDLYYSGYSESERSVSSTLR